MNDEESIEKLEIRVKGAKETKELEDLYLKTDEIFEAIFNEIGKAIVGQRDVVEQIVIALLCDGHVLVEGYPGLGKTKMISVLSKVIDLKFSRIQCTPDLMPSDLTGVYIIEEEDGKKVFRFKPGPIFANIVLVDEINRATPKSQSALLEAMQERQVTVGDETHPLDKPFFVLATQNPIEMEGTYPLPEAQLDRFLFKILIDYPSFEEESKIVDLYSVDISPDTEIRKIITKYELLKLQRLTRQVPISKDIKDYALRIVTKTRDMEDIEYGASPRASIALVLAAKARALIKGRNYVSKEDVEVMAYPVLRHRIILTFDAERRGVTQDEVVRQIIKEVK
ncbi:AAA family ATPase [Archaeoglobales archaeon]|nr:MAG: AAA family ATPase [Archaeoglobales archaeon]